MTTEPLSFIGSAINNAFNFEADSFKHKRLIRKFEAEQRWRMFVDMKWGHMRTLRKASGRSLCIDIILKTVAQELRNNI